MASPPGRSNSVRENAIWLPFWALLLGGVNVHFAGREPQLLYADGKAILLDEDGNLGLVTLSPTGMKVLARASVLQNLAWTPPTLSGTTLYVRDRKTIAAFNLGA